MMDNFNSTRSNFSWKTNIVTFLIATVMLTAAYWQWTRYKEKKILVKHLSDSDQETAIPFDNITEKFKNLSVNPYTKVLIKGKYDFDNQNIIINRRHALGAGFWLLTPFKAEEHGSIIISRGFIPFDHKSPSEWEKYNNTDEVEVLGVIQESVDKRSFLSPSAKTRNPNEWLYPDLKLIQESLPYEINTNYFIQRIGDPVNGQFPAQDIRVDVPPSTHFWYTFEWIALAFFTCLISFLIQKFRPKKTMNRDTEINNFNGNSNIFLLTLVFILLPTNVFAIEDPSDISQRAGIIEKLGNYIDLDLEFTEENGYKTSLKNHFEGDKPVVIAPVYYECPRLCSLTQEGLLKSINNLELLLGEDYKVFSISFNHLETSEQASKRAKVYRNSLSDKIPDPEAWKFMIGEEEEVTKLMNSIGFNYEYDKGEYMHAAGIIILGDDGLISRYLFGIEYKPRDLKLALIEASEGKVGSFLNQALMFCFRYDHIKGQYTLAIWNIIRIVSIGFVLVLIGILINLRVKEKRKKR